MAEDPRNGKEWLEWSQYVLRGIENANEDIKEIRREMAEIHRSIDEINRGCPVHRSETNGLRDTVKTLTMEMEEMKKLRWQILTIATLISLLFPVISKYLSGLLHIAP